MTCQLAALCKRALSRLSWTRAVSFPKLTGLFPTFHTDTPDVERLAQILSERLLMIGGKCSLFRAKAAHVSGQLPVRTGIDILKALALGGRAVFVGRPVICGLAVQGIEGVSQVFEILREELKYAMVLSGCPTIANIDSVLIKQYSL